MIENVFKGTVEAEEEQDSIEDFEWCFCKKKMDCSI